MLGELNQILTGEEKSYVIELWFVTVLFIWMLAKLWIVDVNKNPVERRKLENVREEKPAVPTRSKTVSAQTRPTSRTGIPGIVPLRCDPERCKSQNSVIPQNSSDVVKKKQGEFTPPIPVPYPPSYNHKSNQGVKRRLCELAKSAPRHSNYIQLFLELFSGYKVDINEPLLLNGMTIFHCCCLSVSYKLMVSVIHLADVSILTYHKDSPIYLATAAACRQFSLTGQQPDIRILDILIRSGDDVNQPNLAGFTPLHQAAKHGCEPIVSYLLAMGADPNARSVAKVAPADLSFHFGHTRLTEMINETCNSTSLFFNDILS